MWPYPSAAHTLGAIALAVLAVSACVPRTPPAGFGPVDADLEREAVESTRPPGPLRVVFDWRGREQEANFSGRGVARIEAPDRARLDLFGPRGESFLSTILVHEHVLLPPVRAPIRLPTPALLWSTVGIFRPPAGTELVVAVREGNRIRLEYVNAGERWRFFLEGGRLRRAEWEAASRERQTVELRGTAALGLPAEALFRDWAAFVELSVRPDVIDIVEPYPVDTWSLDPPH